jgi:hypothetical protein
VRKLTEPPEIAQTLGVEEAMTTVSPDVAVAVGVYVAPLTAAAPGAADVIVMALAALLIVNVNGVEPLSA